MQSLEFQGCSQKVVLPGLESFPTVKLDPAYSNGRCPVPHRLVHAFHMGEICDLGANVIDAVGNDRPSVVVTFVNDI